MRSYASVEEIDKKFASCELEMLPVEESRNIDYDSKPTTMVNIPIEMITAVVPDVKEGEILVVVQYERGIVASVCYRDDAEQQRRIELIKELFQK